MKQPTKPFGPCLRVSPRLNYSLQPCARSSTGERGELCEACRENFETKLRRITFERGDFPTKDDVKFLCDPCHDALKPIPFYDEFMNCLLYTSPSPRDGLLS